MKCYISIFFICFYSLIFCQNSLIGIDEQNQDIGSQEQIYKVRADYVIQNNQAKNLYLLRADAKKGMTIKASKKTLMPNDTTLIVVEFIPEHTGKFNETINLVTSADGLPFKMQLSGNIKSIKTDDKTACFYFKKPNNSGVKTIEPMLVPQQTQPRDNSNRIPDNTSVPETKEIVKKPTQTTTQATVEPVAAKNNSLLDEKLYKPNNIIFLVDVSGSMKDTNKLKIMQYALHNLISVLRPTDKITFITYSDTIKVLKDDVRGSDKKELNDVVDSLKAKGLTKGNKAILFSLDVALKNYINDGNNQIILATDGKFNFHQKDQQRYIAKQEDKTIKLTTMAFGNDKEALKNLKDISEIGNGNFIHIKNRARAKEQLLEEIKKNSRIR